MNAGKHEILLATHNPGKVEEMERLLTHLPVHWLTLADIGVKTIIQETGETFAENAIIKAKGYCELTGYWTLADDSGLAVEALGGHPGIHTARYGGANCAPSDKWDLLLRELRGVVWEHRKAQFCCGTRTPRRENDLHLTGNMRRKNRLFLVRYIRFRIRPNILYSRIRSHYGTAFTRQKGSYQPPRTSRPRY